MDVVFISLEALIQKATNASLQQPDPAAIEAFCAVLSDAPDGALLATRVIAARIQSQDAAESLLALTMLDKCMRKCNSHFHAEVGKFRFLNEMIKLVSPKYYANRTSPDVRQKVIQLLHAWQIEYPRESKFKVAYDMLKNQGVVKETPPPLPPEDGPVTLPARPASAVFDDEEKSKLLQKLLRSKNPDDLQAANRLIKTMVREEERRTEARCRRSVEVSAARASARLLAELLGHAAAASPDERQLMAELLAACRRHHPLVQQLAATTHHDERALEEILQASDELTDVFNKYDAVMVQGHQQVQVLSSESVSNGPVLAENSLLDLAGPELPMSIPSNAPSAADTLGELFSSISMAEVPPLQPISLIPSVSGIDDTDTKGTKQADKGLNSLDSLGEDLLKQSLPASLRMLDGFNNKHTKKIPMNALERPQSEPVTATLIDKNTILDLDFLLNKTSESFRTASPLKCGPPGDRATQDDLMVDISMESLNPKCTENLRLNPAPSSHPDNDLLSDVGTASPDTSETYNPSVVVEDKISPTKRCEDTQSTGSTNEVKPLTDINVRLEDIVPSSLPPMTVFEDESGRLSVVLHFGCNRPRPDVFVVVVSTTSKYAEPIEDYKFHAVAPKGCRVRLLPPSGSTLAAHKAFLPAPGDHAGNVGREASLPARTIPYPTPHIQPRQRSAH